MIRALRDSVDAGQRAGPAEALVGATRYPAEFFGMQDSLGTIAPGKLADLVLLDADPLVGIRNTTKIRGVIVRGSYLDRAALDAMLVAAARAAASTAVSTQ
jgi:imidazolonepropionase-like amidohydrolase